MCAKFSVMSDDTIKKAGNSFPEKVVTLNSAGSSSQSFRKILAACLQKILQAKQTVDMTDVK
jgi:major membrane immunogen (membrane-anchored lipoprotein)